MKLQAKFTINFIFLVLVTIVVSFFLINWSVQSQFNLFIQEKTQEWREITKNNSSTLLNPFTLGPSIVMYRETPEDRFLHTVSGSLFLAGIIDVLLAVVLAYFLSNLLLRRIYGLKSAMHHYMEKGISRPISHMGNDEVDDLANIYNLLVEKIAKEERIRRDFFVDMSHELRTPLTSIKGYLQGLVDHVFDREKEDDIHQKTLQETDRMIHLVKEMTSLAKLESEKIKLDKETIDFKELTQEVIEMFVPEIEARKLTVEVQGEATAQADLYKLKQVIINLLDNAIHYSKPENTIFIEMNSTKDKVFWRIKNKTQDTLQKDIEYFFERFYRGDQSRSYDGKRPHLGIGLTIVKKIIEQHAGTIAARMEGDEIVFEISLPLV